MKSSHAALFDLSPAEKLQLIEDLWEDLTKTPEALPLRDWQQEELARVMSRLVLKLSGRSPVLSMLLS